jgi:hypothetical protein
MISIMAPGTLTRGEHLGDAPGNIEGVISRVVPESSGLR